MKFLLGLLTALLSVCAEKPPKVERHDTPPFAVEYMSDYDRKMWEAGCEYDELEWNFHQVLDWDCN